MASRSQAGRTAGSAARDAMQSLLAAVAGASFSVKERTGFATLEIRGIDRTKLASLAEALVPWLW